MDILHKIFETKKLEVEQKKKVQSLGSLMLEARSKQAMANFRFLEQMKLFRDKDGERSGFALIAELKKHSPSKGVLRRDFAVANIAKAYAKGGAACLSVLTDSEYFDGSFSNLQIVKSSTDLPILCKDFIFDAYQIYEAFYYGSDAILLIMAHLELGQARELYDLANELQLSTVFEVHSADELDKVLSLSPSLLGINNRNLKTFEVDFDLCLELSKQVRAEDNIFVIAESGIADRSDIKKLMDNDIYSALVGESLIRQADILSATKDLLDFGQV